MKLEDIVYDLLEVLRTKVKIHWVESQQGYLGKFTLDDASYEIHLDEFDAKILDKTYSLIDFGFTKNGQWTMQGGKSPASKVLGAILNGFSEKIKTINPDAILFGVNFKNGGVESRISLYDKLSKLYVKGSSYSFMSSWIKTRNGQYKIISKNAFTLEEMKVIEKEASEINLKN